MVWTKRVMVTTPRISGRVPRTDTADEQAEKVVDIEHRLEQLVLMRNTGAGGLALTELEHWLDARLREPEEQHAWVGGGARQGAGRG